MNEMHNEVQNSMPNIPMTKLKAHKICDIDIRAIIGQKQRFWMCLHGFFDVQFGFPIVRASANPAVTVQRKAGRQSVSIALSQRSAKTNKKDIW